MIRIRVVLSVVLFIQLARSDSSYGNPPEGSPDALVLQLGHPDPEKRIEAEDALRQLHDKARPAILQGCRSASPAISDAAKALLMPLSWHQADDPAFVLKFLTGYGRKTSSERRSAFSNIVQHDPEIAAPIFFRLAQEEPDESIVWSACFDVFREKPLVRAAARLELKNLRPALRIVRAWARLNPDVEGYIKVSNEDVDELVNAVHLAQELNAESREMDTLFGTLHGVGRFSRTAAGELQLRRLRVKVCENDKLNYHDAVRDVLAVHFRQGIQAGLLSDMAAVVKVQNAPAVEMGMVALMREVGMNIPSLIIEQNIRQRLEADKSARSRVSLHCHLGEQFARWGILAFAERAYLDAIAIEADDASDRQIEARKSLAEIYARTNRFAEAVAAMESAAKAVEQLPPPVNEQFRKRIQTYTQLYKLREAMAEGQAATATDAARAIVAIGTEETEVIGTVTLWLDSQGLSREADPLFQPKYFSYKQGVKTSERKNKWRHWLAQLCARSGRHLDEAVEMSRLASEMYSEEAEYFTPLAEAHWRLGNIDLAQAAADRVFSLDRTKYYAKHLQNLGLNPSAQK